MLVLRLDTTVVFGPSCTDTLTISIDSFGKFPMQLDPNAVETMSVSALKAIIISLLEEHRGEAFLAPLWLTGCTDSEFAH